MGRHGVHVGRFWPLCWGDVEHHVVSWSILQKPRETIGFSMFLVGWGVQLGGKLGLLEGMLAPSLVSWGNFGSSRLQVGRSWGHLVLHVGAKML